TFTLGKFGGHEGRTLAAGDVLKVRDLSERDGDPARTPVRIASELHPVIGSHWELAVTVGPHSAPEYFTPDDIETLYGTDYEVHFNSDRTGVRLIGPKPQWARPDGGEAGLHPSNIHDNAYSIGALDFTGDTPILLGPDGPSLGGFVCPVTVTSADRWKLGQLAPGDQVRFVPVRGEHAAPVAALNVSRRANRHSVLSGGGDLDEGILGRGVTADGATSITYRRSGDDNILVEYGDMTLDLRLRARGHALVTALRELGDPSITDLTPGVRSVQVKFDPSRTTTARTLALLGEVESSLTALDELRVPSRTVRLPLSWDDPATREAIQRYMHGVRSDAPWCLWNIEFIRRMNGLGSVDDVREIVYGAQYLVLGLGDVYLGAPVATPLDPRHRLVTTKYNPARTWTPENAVGIGGAYLCVYGMEGPGGYQFVGRTTQMWNHRHPLPAAGFDHEHPWLLRNFDRIEWYSVSADELLDLRADVAAGRGSVDITPGEFAIADYEQFLADNAADIESTRQRMQAARDEERERWRASGELGTTGGNR
ncbi:MAG: carboxyltransferase domain-containing protein, partial [Gordonia sp. (in: high G+C Gram-positive bacteria)]